MSMLTEGNPLVWFEVPAADLERAKAFYDSIFDIDVQIMDLGELRFGFFPMKESAPNGAGALVHHPTGYTPSHEGSLVYFGVTDLEAVLARVVQAGGRVIEHRKAIGEFGFVAFLEDSEGNRVGLHSRT